MIAWPARVRVWSRSWSRGRRLILDWCTHSCYGWMIIICRRCIGCGSVTACTRYTWIRCLNTRTHTRGWGRLITGGWAANVVMHFSCHSLCSWWVSRRWSWRSYHRSRGPRRPLMTASSSGVLDYVLRVKLISIKNDENGWRWPVINTGIVQITCRVRRPPSMELRQGIARLFLSFFKYWNNSICTGKSKTLSKTRTVLFIRGAS